MASELERLGAALRADGGSDGGGPLRLRLAAAWSVSAGVVTIVLAGDVLQVPLLAGAVLGDTVWVLTQGPNPWLVVGAELGSVVDPAQDDVAASETRTSTSYGDLATVGPLKTVPLIAGQRCLVTVMAEASIDLGAGHSANMGWAVSGAETVAANDVDAAVTQSATSVPVAWTSVFAAATSGDHVFTAKYKQVNGNTATFKHRRLIVQRC